MIRIPNLRLGLDETEEKLRERASRALRLAPERLWELRLVKKSVDARDKRDLHYVCTVLVAVEGDEEAALRRSMIGSGDRSEKIRTYNYPQNRVSDHRIGLTITQLDRIMDGKLDDIVAALLENEKKEKLLNENI